MCIYIIHSIEYLVFERLRYAQEYSSSAQQLNFPAVIFYRITLLILQHSKGIDLGLFEFAPNSTYSSNK